MLLFRYFLLAFNVQLFSNSATIGVLSGDRRQQQRSKNLHYIIAFWFAPTVMCEREVDVIQQSFPLCTNLQWLLLFLLSVTADSNNKDDSYTTGFPYA